MVRLPQQRSWSTSRPAQRTRRRPVVEQLESRQLLTASISVADATLSEIGSPSAFITAGSGGLDSPRLLTLGPDGNVYVVSNATNSVIRYNSTTGQLIGTFVTGGSGGLTSPNGLAFGPDNHLYVTSGNSNSINRYHGTTGASLGAFVPAGSGGIVNPGGLAFGVDGNLYVTSVDSDAVLRYQGPLGPSPGSPLPGVGKSGATFVSTGSGGLNLPVNVVFGPDGRLYVAAIAQGVVLRFDGATGDFIDPFVPTEDSLDNPRGMAFDADGRLYVADADDNAVRRYDAQGNHMDDPVPTGSGSSLVRAFGLAFDATGNLLIGSLDSDAVLRYSSGPLVSLSQAGASAVSVNYATEAGTADSNSDFTSQVGTITFAPGQTSRRVLLATRDDLANEGNESFSLVLSSPTAGATIADGDAIVTIVDDDSARQVTINDGAATEGDHQAHFRGPFVTGNFRDFSQISFGPNNIMYVATNQGEIRRYNALSGAFIDSLVPPGRIYVATDIRFRDGFMYVGNEDTDEVLRFNLNTGAFVDAFVTAGSGGLDGPQGVTFGPDVTNDGIPELYVSGRISHNVVRYNGATGAPLPGTYVTTGSGGLAWPEGLTFDPTGTVLLVSSAGTNQILKYDALSGAFLGVAASTALSGPIDVKFGPDGLMYVASARNDRIIRFNTQGAYVDDYVPAGAGGMDFPFRVHFGPDGDLYVTAGPTTSTVLRFGTESESLITVGISTPSDLPITVDYATADGSAVDGSDYAATSGTVTFEPGVTSKIIRVPILDDAPAASEPTETFLVNVSLNPSNPEAATIADGQATVSIMDNDPFTKFYVVNDASTDRTYEYQSAGAAVENYALGSGNTAPRGAASTAAGTSIWVVDANKKVYVYDTSGTLAGSWTAGGLQSNASLEGIATDGSDVWLVDAQTDKIYRYTGAATRTSGSQNAASSFSLNSGNTNPKDIVTDGSYLWTVNDGSSDYVFKYTVAGTYVGKWKISTSGAKAPTGITLDPSNPAHIWIVDSGTDRVYQYDNAASLTSGSRSASGNFVLASGNTNPQGIADPPAPSPEPATGPVAISSDAGSLHPMVLALLGSRASARPQVPEPRVLTHRTVDEVISSLGSEHRHVPNAAGREFTVSDSARRSGHRDFALLHDELEATIGSLADDLAITELPRRGR